MAQSAAHLVDASIFIFRAWFSLPADAWQAPDGTPLNAVVGWGRSLFALLDRVGPGVPVVACFDESLTTCFRNELYPAYKANRDRPDAALSRQLGWCRELAQMAGVQTWADGRWEADDLIASAQAALGRPVVIHTRDKDLGQLLGPGDRLRDPDGKDSFSHDVQQRFGVSPAQLPCWQGLAGDSVDNIPGVRGVGPKTATQLLRAFGDLDAVLAAAAGDEELPVRRPAAVRRDLREQADEALLFRELARMRADVPMPFAADDTLWRGPHAELPGWLDALGLGRTLGGAAGRLGG